MRYPDPVLYATDPNLADIAVKDEGYADVRFRTTAAKLMAIELGIPNTLQEFGAEFCGKKVYYHDKPETHDGIYRCGMKPDRLNRLAMEMNKRGLTAHPDTDFLQGKPPVTPASLEAAIQHWQERKSK